METATLKILIADDERTIAQTLALIMQLNGHESKAVYSGEEAVAAATEFRPNALVSDVVMGGMTGIEAAIHIQRMCPECRVILVSDQAGTSELLAAAKAQGYYFELLSKPVHPEAILQKLKDGHSNAPDHDG